MKAPLTFFWVFSFSLFLISVADAKTKKKTEPKLSLTQQAQKELTPKSYAGPSEQVVKANTPDLDFDAKVRDRKFSLLLGSYEARGIGRVGVSDGVDYSKASRFPFLTAQWDQVLARPYTGLLALGYQLSASYGYLKMSLESQGTSYVYKNVYLHTLTGQVGPLLQIRLDKKEKWHLLASPKIGYFQYTQSSPNTLANDTQNSWTWAANAALSWSFASNYQVLASYEFRKSLAPTKRFDVAPHYGALGMGVRF